MSHESDETPEPTADGGVEVHSPDADPRGQADERPPRPEALDLRAENIPATLRRFDNWVSWAYEWKPDDERWTKIPVDAETGRLARSDDPGTWTDFETAVAFHLEGDRRTDGVGFMLDDTDRFVGVDLDDCRDRESGERDGWADDVLDRLDTYRENSPSGTGLRAFAVGTLPEGRRKRGVDGAEGDIEMYDDGRYLTVTGHRVGDETDVAAVAEAIADVHADYLADDPDTDENPGGEPADLGDPDRDRDHGREMGTATAPAGDVDLSDEAVVEKAKAADNGAKFGRLWNGRPTGYDSHSEADMALCTLLAFWTGGDRQQMDRLFRDSGLMREKWDETHRADGSTYGEMTVEAAQDAVSAYYDPSHGDGTEAATAAADGGVSDDTVALSFIVHEGEGVRLLLHPERGDEVRVIVEQDGERVVNLTKDHGFWDSDHHRSTLGNTVGDACEGDDDALKGGTIEALDTVANDALDREDFADRLTAASGLVADLKARTVEVVAHPGADDAEYRVTLEPPAGSDVTDARTFSLGAGDLNDYNATVFRRAHTANFTERVDLDGDEWMELVDEWLEVAEQRTPDADHEREAAVETFVEDAGALTAVAREHFDPDNPQMEAFYEADYYDGDDAVCVPGSWVIDEWLDDHGYVGSGRELSAALQEEGVILQAPSREYFDGREMRYWPLDAGLTEYEPDNLPVPAHAVDETGEDTDGAAVDDEPGDDGQASLDDAPEWLE